MYNRAFPVGNALFLFAGGMMSLFCLPSGKLPLSFLAVPVGKDGRVECPCPTVDDFIGIRGNVCGLFLFVQTHAPLIVPPWQSRARKSKFQFHIRRKGADAFRPALAAGGSLMAYKCLPLCGLFSFFKGLNKKKKSTNISPYPDEVIDRLARAFYPAILACWNSEEGQRELAEKNQFDRVIPYHRDRKSVV